MLVKQQENREEKEKFMWFSCDCSIYVTYEGQPINVRNHKNV